MKKIFKNLFSFISISLLFINIDLKAQENIVFEEGKELIKEYPTKEIKGSGAELYLKSGGQEFTINKINLPDIRSEMTSKQMTKLNKENKEYTFDFNKDTAYFVNSRIEMVYDVWSKKQLKKIIYFMALATDGKVVQEAKELFSAESKGPYDCENTPYALSYSPDKSTMALFIENGVKSGSAVNILMIFNSKDLSLKSSREFPREYNGTKIRTRLENVDNNGNVTIRFSTVETLTRENSKLTYDKTIGTYFASIKIEDKSISNVKELPFDKTKKLHSVIEERTADGKLIRGGIYSPVNEADPTNYGIFYSVIDMNTGSVIQETYNPFAPNVIDKLNYTITTDMQKKAPGYTNFRTRQIISLNGSYYIVCEHAFSFTSQKGLSSISTMELLISKYNASGKNEWQVIIPKSTYPGATPNVSTGTYELVLGKDKLYFIFLDHPKNSENLTLTNYNMDDYKSIGRSYNANVACVTITEKGDASKSILFENPKDGFVFVPRNLNIRKGNTNIILYQSIDQRKYGTITIK